VSAAILESRVVRGGTCTGCGACVALDRHRSSRMRGTARGVVPELGREVDLPEWTLDACPGYGIDYPALTRLHYGAAATEALVGPFIAVRTGFAADPRIRTAGASGGVMTRTLLHLLESGRVDGAVLVRQGTPTPAEARAVVVDSAEEILRCAQSVYVPVSTLDVLPRLDPGRRYAITCLPEQSAALRVMQARGFGPALAVKYVLGPYTGTALEPGAVRALLRGAGVKDDDEITSLQWRAGEWPGHLEITTASGRLVRSRKAHYNFLIPFFVTQTSLQGMDFANEFADLSVGDAWSPVLESLGGGHSVFLTRSKEMEAVVSEMVREGLLEAREETRDKASEMHGHMIDFKKRGGYIRNRMRRALCLAAPDWGHRPEPIGALRLAVEAVIAGVFAICRTAPARSLAARMPESVLGPVFDWLRVAWKELSRPAKRRRLRELRMVPTRHG
jgi:coenzyme F420 hydrogenase subunit beta